MFSSASPEQKEPLTSLINDDRATEQGLDSTSAPTFPIGLRKRCKQLRRPRRATVTTPTIIKHVVVGITLVTVCLLARAQRLLYAEKLSSFIRDARAKPEEIGQQALVGGSCPDCRMLTGG